MNPLDRFDSTVDGWFDHLRGRPAADRLMYALSELGDFSLIWHTAGVAEAVACSDPGVRRAVRLSTTLGVESALVNGLVKSVVRRERPSHGGERPHRLRRPVTSSFPSGHASAGACAAVLLGDGRSRPVRLFWWALAALVAASRVHVRIHHPSDVVGGATIGAAIGGAARRLSPLR